MTYLIEGTHGAGKTTFAKSLGLPIIHTPYIDVKTLLKNLQRENVVYDRGFILPLVDNDINLINCAVQLEDFLRRNNDIKSYLFICDREEGWQRYLVKTEGQAEREEYDKLYDACLLVKDYVPSMQLINIDEGDVPVYGCRNQKIQKSN